MKRLLPHIKCLGMIGILWMMLQRFNGAEEHMAQANKTDWAIEEARKLRLTMPLMCREWHVWWGAPWGNEAFTPGYFHWKGYRHYGAFDAQTNIEDTVPGLAWRRYLNCVGYPLLGPYDSGQRDIIRWQLQTAKNAGLECLHLHLWPSIFDNGTDVTPVETADKAFDLAAELNFPIALHDEVMFRKPNVSKAQTLASSIARTTAILRRYGSHPGIYKIDGMPFYYLQNWNKWCSPADMQTYMAQVEQEVGPVFWVVEMDTIRAYLDIPEIRAFCGTHTDSFLHKAPNYGQPPHDWQELEKSMTADAEQVRAAGKKFGINLKTRFNNNHDRGKPGHGVIPAEDGAYLLESLKLAQKLQPDFIILAQWNDFEEGAFIEPAWDFDGFNGDPYRWCRITAALKDKTFVPAPLPPRESLDPMIRAKLFPEPAAGDAGPVMQQQAIEDRTLRWIWATEGRTPATIGLHQQSLVQWTPGEPAYRGQPLRLGNFSITGGGSRLDNGEELRFYAPGMRLDHPKTVWMGVECTLTDPANLRVYFRAQHDNYRLDSKWQRTMATPAGGYSISLDDRRSFYWFPLYHAAFNGTEGDLVLQSRNTKETILIRRILLWQDGHPDATLTVNDHTTSAMLPEGIDPKQPLVICPADAIGNPGIPRIFYQGQTTIAKPIPMSDSASGRSVMTPVPEN